MDTTREDPTVRSSGRIQHSSAADTFVLGRPFRPRRRGWGFGAAAVVVALVAGSMATGVRSPSQHPALRLVSDATVRPSRPVSYGTRQAGPKGVWRQVPLPAAVRGAGSPVSAPGVSTAGSQPAAGAPSGSFQGAPGSGSGTAATSSGASAPQAPAAPGGAAPLPAEPLPQLPAAVATPTDSPTP